MANAVKNIAKFIRNNPEDQASVVLRDLSLAIELKKPFDLSCIYDLDRKPFELAIALLEQWRFDRHVVTRRLQKYLDHGDDE